MALPLPNLDNRQWIDLVDEGRALIPRYAPDWTDHNASDPGITLIELFAWLSEMTIYRLNRVPERHLQKFLGLLGLYSLPPRAARSVLSFFPEAGFSPLELQAGVEFELLEPSGPSTHYRTLHDLNVAFVDLNAMQLEQLDHSVEPSQRVFIDLTRDWREGVPIEPLGHDPRTEPILYMGFDALPTGIPIALAFHFLGSANDGVERARLISEVAAQRAACRPILPDISCEDGPASLPPPLEELPLHHSVKLVWEVLTGMVPEQWSVLEAVVGRATPEVGEVMDDTRSLTLDGIVEFNLPESIVRGTLGQVTESLFYIRCRLTAGSHDAPPIVTEITPNGVYVEQAVPVLQSFEIAAGATVDDSELDPDNLSQPIRLDFTLDNTGVIQAITFFAPDTAPDHPDLLVLEYSVPGVPTPETPGHLTLQAVLLGIGNGRPEQRFRLPQPFVQIESLELYTHSEGTWQQWTQRNDFDPSSRVDFHFTLNATNGDVTFGSGERGRVVPKDTPIIAVFRATQGEVGNVRSVAGFRLADAPKNGLLLSDTERDQLAEIRIIQLPLQDGAVEEPLEGTIGRAVETLHAHQRLLDLCAQTHCTSLDDVPLDRVLSLRAPARGVNLLDIERLALNVPGTRVARARAWPATHPSYPCLQAEGVVTLVVMPDLPVPKPEPSEGLVKAIKRYLDRRRMVTTRLEVVGPQYLEVRVDARVRARFFADIARVRERIIEALNTFLDPRIGGPDRIGWPFGRNVYRSEILQLIDNVVNVDHILDLSLQSATGRPQCGNLTVCPTWLVTPGEHRIDVVRSGS